MTGSLKREYSSYTRHLLTAVQCEYFPEKLAQNGHSVDNYKFCSIYCILTQFEKPI